MLLFTLVIMKHQHEYKDWFLPQRVSPPRRVNTRQWETSFRSLFTGQPSYLPEISDPQTLDSCRVETKNRLREHQALSLVSWLFLQSMRKSILFGSACDMTKRDRWESTPQGRVMCEYYWLSVLMSTGISRKRKMLFLFRESSKTDQFWWTPSLRDSWQRLKNRHVLGCATVKSVFRQSWSRSSSSE